MIDSHIVIMGACIVIWWIVLMLALAAALGVAGELIAYVILFCRDDPSRNIMFAISNAIMAIGLISVMICLKYFYVWIGQ